MEGYRIVEMDGPVEWQEGDLFCYAGQVWFIYQLDWSPEKGFTAYAHPDHDGTADVLHFTLDASCVPVEAV